jgi:hypothetical protein
MVKAPNSKLQAPEKFQTPSSNMLGRQLVFDLELGSSLELGAWNLELSFG